MKIKGHSIEVRVYAENPKENFLPETGRLETYKIPQGPGIRVDDGFEEGMDIPIYYDPMIAKLVATGENREQARMRMLRAINEYEITGISTTLDFCSFALKHDAFISGDFDTKFVQNHFKPEYLDAHNEEEETIAIALAAYALEEKKKATNRADASGQLSKWKLRAKQ